MKKIGLFLFVGLMAACSSDNNGVVIDCTDDELYDPKADICVPRGMAQSDVGTPDVGVADEGTNNTVPDVGVPDEGPDEDVVDNSRCDRDNDGALAYACGGDDCDDSAPFKSPLLPEFCDDIDNDCSGEINDGIDCSFYAHSNDALYRVDPFSKTVETIDAVMPTRGDTLQDIDTHPDGTLYGVSFSGLFKYNPTTKTWSNVGEFGIDVGDPNGMAIDLGGTVLITSQTKVYTVDTTTGAATELGDMQGDFYSSGDCVVNKYDTLFMTSKYTDNTIPDDLISIDRNTGIGTKIGSTGFSRIYALTAAWGRLWGLTGQGELITINERTGESELVETFDGVRFFGAASTPSR